MKDFFQFKAELNEKKEVDEISMGKMQAYGKAAAKDIDQKRNKVKAALDQPASVKHAKAGMKAMQGLTKRSRGSDMYVNKMTGRSKVKPTAEAKVDEISMDKARATFQARQKLKNRAGLAGDAATAKKHQDKARKTQDIIRKRNMANEATMDTLAGRKQASAEADAHHKAMVKKWGISHPATKDAEKAANAMRAKIKG